MENYLIIKNIHIVLAVLSVSIFTLRGIMMIINIPHYQHRLFRLVTPLVDTVLLILGIAMATLIGAAIFQIPWFVVKLILILLYIVSAILAINRFKRRSHKLVALGFAWLFAVAIFYLAIYKPVLW